LPQAKDKKVAEFVEELSPNQRKLLRPDLPSPLNDLPQDVHCRLLISPFTLQCDFQVKDQIQEIFDDQKMDTKTRHQKFWKLIKSLPAEQKILVQDSFAKPIAPPMLVPPPSAAQIPQL
jgi:hypothetical protein